MRSSTCLSCDDNSLVNGQPSLFTMYCTPLKTWPQFSPRESSYEPLQPLSWKCWPEPPQGCQKDQAKIWDCPYVLNPKKMPLKADLCWSNHKNVSNIPSTSPQNFKIHQNNVLRHIRDKWPVYCTGYQEEYGIQCRCHLHLKFYSKYLATGLLSCVNFGNSS